MQVGVASNPSAPRGSEYGLFTEIVGDDDGSMVSPAGHFGEAPFGIEQAGLCIYCIKAFSLGQAGRDYGWNDREGTYRFDPKGARHEVFALTEEERASDPPNMTYPVAQYDHTMGFAIAGVAFTVDWLYLRSMANMFLEIS